MEVLLIGKMKTKTIKITPEKFHQLYYKVELEIKYGEDWMDRVVEDLEEEGIKIEFDYS